MGHVIVIAVGLYLLCCYGWGAYVTVRVVSAGCRQAARQVRGASPLARIRPASDQEPARRKAA